MAKSTDPFLAFYVADYLGDTLHLTTRQHGAYLLILFALYRQGGFMRFTPSNMVQITKLSAEEWAEDRENVLGFFTVENGQISNSRLLTEIGAAKDLRRKRSDSGKIGAENKRLKKQGSGVSKAEANGQAKRKPSPSPIDSTLEGSNEPSNFESIGEDGGGGAQAVDNKPDLMAWKDRLLAVAGPGMADPIHSQKIHLTTGIIGQWIRLGADLELDAVPIVQAMTRTVPSTGIIEYWKYFDREIRRHHEERTSDRLEGAKYATGNANGNHVAIRGRSEPNRLAEALDARQRAARMADEQRQRERCAALPDAEGDNIVRLEGFARKS